MYRNQSLQDIISVPIEEISHFRKSITASLEGMSCRAYPKNVRQIAIEQNTCFPQETIGISRTSNDTIRVVTCVIG